MSAREIEGDGCSGMGNTKGMSCRPSTVRQSMIDRLEPRNRLRLKGMAWLKAMYDQTWYIFRYVRSE